MFVRPATPDDAERLASVHVDAWKAAYRGQVPDEHLDALSADGRLDSWRKLLDEVEESTSTFVLVDGDRPVGFAYCMVLGAELTGELASMYLDPPVWRRGGGRLLIAAATDWFTAKACGEATLWVLEENTAARHFYEAMGWKPDGARRPIELGGSGLVEVRYRRAL